MQTSSDVAAAHRLTAWVEALDEVHDEALRARRGDSDPSQSIAILHVLEQRAHEAFRDYREHLLRP